MNVNKQNFKRLAKIIDLDAIREQRFDSAVSKVSAFMDLHYDYLYGSDMTATIALHHSSRVNGDSVPDPDMEFRVHFEYKTVRALTYQDSFGYQDVVRSNGTIDTALQRKLDRFAAQWLKNLYDQGHRLDGADKDGMTLAVIDEGGMTVQQDVGPEQLHDTLFSILKS